MTLGSEVGGGVGCGLRCGLGQGRGGGPGGRLGQGRGGQGQVTCDPLCYLIVLESKKFSVIMLVQLVGSEWNCNIE